MIWEGLPSLPLMLVLDPLDLLLMSQIKSWKEGFPSTWLPLLQFSRLTPSSKKTMGYISVGLIIEEDGLSQPQLTWVSLVSLFPWCTSYIWWSCDAWVTISTGISCCCCCQKQQSCWFLWRVWTEQTEQILLLAWWGLYFRVMFLFLILSRVISIFSLLQEEEENASHLHSRVMQFSFFLSKERRHISLFNPCLPLQKKGYDAWGACSWNWSFG